MQDTAQAFREWLDAGRPRQFVAGGETWLRETLLVALADVAELLPERYCSMLGMAPHTTHGEAARALRADRGWLPARSDPAGLRPISTTATDERLTLRLSRDTLARMADGEPLLIERRVGMDRELVVRVER